MCPPGPADGRAAPGPCTVSVATRAATAWRDLHAHEAVVVRRNPAEAPSKKLEVRAVVGSRGNPVVHPFDGLRGQNAGIELPGQVAALWIKWILDNSVVLLLARPDRVERPQSLHFRPGPPSHLDQHRRQGVDLHGVPHHHHDMPLEIGRVRLFFVEEFLPYSWAFLPADASLQCSFRGDSNQASAYPRLSGGQPSLETVPNTVGLSPSGALPSGHSRGVLVRFHGQGDRPVMAVTTGFQGRRFDAPEARTGVPRIDLPSPAPCAAADAVFADAKAFLSSNEARQMSESELERELHRRGQKLVRKLLQGHHDQRSPGQVAGPAEDASGVECSARREHDSHAETTSGTMQVVGLGCARRGHDGLHPLDAALNLLPERSLVDMRRRVTIATASRAPPRTPWKPQWYSTLSTWQRRCGVRCSSPAH